MKEYLRKTQPVFYRILERSFKSGTHTHAYLIVGDHTDDAVTFLSQSLICQEDVLACEECDDCKRIATKNYPDLISYDGNEKSIKKSDIDHLQKEFVKSSVENKGKIYVLKNVEKSSVNAMNSLLKFLEEPLDDVYAILTTRNISKVLPTIQSRCQVINLLPESKNAVKIALQEKGLSEEDASILSQMFSSVDAAYEMSETEAYEDFKRNALYFVEDLYTHPRNLMFNQEIHISKPYSNDRNMIIIYLNMVVLALRDVFHVKHSIKPVFSEGSVIFDNLPNDDKILMKIEVILETIDLISMNANISLLLDRMVYRIVEGVI